MLDSVAVWSVANRLVLGCEFVDEKSNEITPIPELLKKLELCGAIITTDAMGSQKEIAKQISDDGGDYVLAIKDNHPKLAKAMGEYFDKVHEQGVGEHKARHHETHDKEHGSTESGTIIKPPSQNVCGNLPRHGKALSQLNKCTA